MNIAKAVFISAVITVSVVGVPLIAGYFVHNAIFPGGL